MKRFLLLATAILCTTSISATQAAFSDISTTSEYYDAISYVQANGIVSGYSDGTYKADMQINRAEFLKIVVSARFSKESIQICQQNYIRAGKSTIDFADVATNEWYAPYVCLAKAQNIIEGYPDGTMKPGQQISFVEAAKIIAVTSGMPSKISSADGIWYKPYVKFLEELKAIPTSITRFDKNITRGEMAEIIYRQKSGTYTKASTTYDDLVLGNIVSGITDCDTLPAEIFPKSEGVLPHPSTTMDKSITQYISAEGSNNEAFMSVYRNISDGLTGCESKAEDPATKAIVHFLRTGNGPIEEVPNYIGDIISAFGYFDTEASKIADLENITYKGTTTIRAMYSLEGTVLPGAIHVRIIAQKGDSYVMLSKNLENKITDPTKYFAYGAMQGCGGQEKHDRECILRTVGENSALRTFALQQATELTEVFALSE